ncbi:DUF6529 family protein [Streptomyces sp. NPDC096152]|uniref:DUF6529 family protein n=1 Tax=Streptomyces sp. NPDC096152 TaxID=3366078 RepID=UPI0037F56A2D
MHHRLRRQPDRNPRGAALARRLFPRALVANVVVVRHRRSPGWALPLAGGALVTVIALAWYSAAFWYLNGYWAPGL